MFPPARLFIPIYLLIMKIIITEEQAKNLRMKEAIRKILNMEFKNSNIICEIVVKDIDEEEEDYDNGMRYDIWVYLNEKFVRNVGIYGFRIATTKKINKALLDWLGLDKSKYYISIVAKDC